MDVIFTKPQPEYLKLLVEKEILESLPEVPRELTPEQLKALKSEIDIDKPSFDLFVERELTPSEIAYYRRSYQIQVEDVLPELERELEELKAEYKKKLKELEGQIAAARTIVKDSVAMIKQGRDEYKIPADKTLRFVYKGHWLYYAKIDEGDNLQLVKVHSLTDIDKKELQATLFRRDATDKLPELIKNESDETTWTSEQIQKELAG